jgi:ABC-2 type transport system permease protein
MLCAVVITVFHFPFTLPQHLYTIPLLFLSILFGNLIAFNLKMIVSCAAFWLEEAHPVRVVYWIMSNVFMGWVGPLVLFPHWFQILSALLPWQYTLYTPVMIYMEVFNMHATLQSLLGAAIWLVIVTIARRIVLAKSLRHFNAVGH